MTDAYAAAMPKNPRTSTRDRILDAALDLFVERGVAGTTVSDIERAVGLAAGTGSFYRHFPSKEDVVVPAFERRITQLVQELEAERAVLSSIDDPVDRLVRDYGSRLDEMRRIHPLWILLLGERDQFPDLQEVFLEVLGIRTWDFSWNENPSRAIAIAALTGYNQLALLQDGSFRGIPADEFIAALVEFTLGRHASSPADRG